MREKTGRFFRKYPLTAMCLVSAVCGFVAVFLWCVSLLLFREVSFASFIEFMTEAFFLCGFVGILGGLCLILPILLTVIQVGSLWIELKGREQTVRLRHIDLCTIGLGIICNICLLSVVKGVQFDSD